LIGSLECLEIRRLLSASGTAGAPAPLPLPAQTTLEFQLASGPNGSLATLLPLISAAGATVSPTLLPGLYEVVGPSSSMNALATQLASSPAVQYAEPMLTVTDLQAPNDPSYTNGAEWQLNGQWGINAPGAWSITVGSNSVTIADTDTGIAYNNTELYSNVWINQAEIPSAVMANLKDVNGDGLITFTDLNNAVNQGAGKIVDTNGDGIITAADLLAATSAGGWASGSTQDSSVDPGPAYADDLVGWNFAANTDNPLDANGHGTFTAGEIGAVTNNGIGVAGTVWNAQIMPVQFLDSSGSGTDVAAALAIEYAVNHGAKVINASWGGSGTDSTIASAIQYADAHNVIIVAAAGNNGTDDDNSSTWFSPASYSVDYPNLISVAAIGSNGTLAGWSDYGVASVQLAAPGVNLYGVGLNNTYVYDSGTSMAAPLVTGTIALVESAHPTWTMAQVIDAVLDTTTLDPALNGKVATSGVVNAAAAVANTDGPYVVSATPDGSINSAAGISTITLNFNEEINPATFTSSLVTLTGPSGAIAVTGVAAVSGSNDHQFTISFATQASAGTYTLKLAPSVQDWYGNNLNQNRNGVNGETSDAFTETIRQTAPGSSDLFSVTGVPSTVGAGTSQTFIVTALSPSGGTDASYMGTVQFSSSDPSAVLPSSATLTNGTATFSVTFKTAGLQSITATDAANKAIIGTEENILVQAGVASTFKVVPAPGPVTALTAESFTVTALDVYGNIALGYAGTVNFTSSDSAAILPGAVTVFPEQQATFSVTVTYAHAGTQTLTATDSATTSITGTVSVNVNPGITPVTYVGQDTTTQGNWINKYGKLGYDLIDIGSSLPTGVGVSVSGNMTYSWANPAPSTATQALQVPPTGSTRSADCWYANNSFTVNVNAGTGSYNLELYFVDYEPDNRSEQIQFSSASTGIVLSTQTISSFAGGIYLNYTISGNINITISRTAGPNTVLSGLFFDSTGPYATATSVVSSLAPSTYGQAVTFTSTVSDSGGGVPTGSVEFFDGSTDLGHGTVLTGSGSSAISTFTTSALFAGIHPAITAVYTANGNFVSSSGSVSQTVSAAPLVITAVTNTKVYDGTTSAAAIPTVAGLVGSDTVTNLSETYATSAVGTGKTLNVATYTINDGNGGQNYSVTLVPNTSGVITTYGTAAYLAQDSTTQGNWIGAYGSLGYDIANIGSSLPSGVTVTPTGATPYTWSSNSTRTVALQLPSNSSKRSATCWYSNTSFTINVNTGLSSYNLELYFVDYEPDNRSEQVQVTNAGTGAVLSTQSLSSFANGLYFRYTIAGNVNITVTRVAGPNTVLSALFFDPVGSTATTTSVGSSLAPSTYGQAVTFTSTVSDTGGGVPSGSVEFFDGSTDLGHGSVLTGSGSSATSTFTTSALFAGVHPSITAVYTATGNFVSSSGSMSQTVTAAPLVITAVANSKPYDGTTSAAAIPTVAGLVGSDTVTNLSETYATSAVGTGKTLNVATYTINDGNGGQNYSVTLVPNNSGVITAYGTATYLAQDTTTQGTWIGAYGSLGYDIANIGSSLPSGVSVTPTGATAYTWSSNSTRTAALQLPSNSSKRSATCWYSNTSFTINVNTGVGSYNLELYFVDYEPDNRSEQVQLTNAATGAVLTTQSVSSFANGVYLKYTIAGSVNIVVSKVAGPNAVMSGLFIDPASSSAALVAASPPVASAGTAPGIQIEGFAPADTSATNAPAAPSARPLPLISVLPGASRWRARAAQSRALKPLDWNGSFGTS
jgi:subtilisin family serine protease